MTSYQSAFQQAFLFLSQGIHAKLFREQGQWRCTEVRVPVYNTK